MLSPRLTNCPECSDISFLLKKIDCKLAELGNNLYNNISYMLNKPVPADDITQLIGYRRILMYKLCNPSYVHEYSVSMIASRVIRLTVGCVSRCNTPEPCIEERCDITIVPNPTTTTSTTAIPTTTTTSSSSTSTSTSSTTTSTSSSSTTTTTTTFIPPGAVPISILLEYQTISPVEDIVVSNTLEDACIFVNNFETGNITTNSYVLDSTTYYYDEETSMLYNSVTNTFAEDGYYISDEPLYVTNGLVEILTLQDLEELCNFTTTTTTTTLLIPTTTTTSSSSTSTTTSTSSSTTTTTTIPPTTTTTTTIVNFAHGFSAGKADNLLACAETVVAITLYTSVPTIAFGTFMYTDPGLTTPFIGGVLFYKNISLNNGIRTGGTGQVSNLFSC